MRDPVTGRNRGELVQFFLSEKYCHQFQGLPTRVICGLRNDLECLYGLEIVAPAGNENAVYWRHKPTWAQQALAERLLNGCVQVDVQESITGISLNKEIVAHG